MQHTSASVDGPASRSPLTLRTLLALIATAIVSAGSIACVAPITGMGSVGPMLLVFVGTWIAFSVILGRSLARTVGMRVVIFIAMFVIVYVAFALVIQLLIARLVSNPPPRPMFHNYFGEHERVLLPYWHEDWAMSDSLGNLMWADHDDNVLVVVLRGAPDGTWRGPITGHDETRFAIGDGWADRWTTIERTTNTLVVIFPDGDVDRFPLPANVVQSFREQRRSKVIKDLMADVGVLLDVKDRAHLKSLVSKIER